VVSLSGPHKGTPIARRLRGALEGTIKALFLVSFWAKYDAQKPGEPALSRGLHRAELYERAAQALATKSAKPFSTADVAGLHGSTAEELIRFLQEITDDHPLIHELTPYAMDHLNDHLSRSKASRPPLPVKYFITVAPPPSVHLNEIRLHGGVDLVRRVLYTASYEETRLTENEFGALPAARPWIGAPTDFAKYAATAQDGVVPAASQSFDGKVESFVYGDHLDVVGHYPTAKHGGETVFDSGADFDDARLEELWTRIGDLM
jgi:hypothetical protein